MKRCFSQVCFLPPQADIGASFHVRFAPEPDVDPCARNVRVSTAGLRHRLMETARTLRRLQRSGSAAGLAPPPRHGCEAAGARLKSARRSVTWSSGARPNQDRTARSFRRCCAGRGCRHRASPRTNLARLRRQRNLRLPSLRRVRPATGITGKARTVLADQDSRNGNLKCNAAQA